MLSPSLTVPNLLPNMDESKKKKFTPILLRRRVKSFFFSWAWFFLNKSMNIGRTLLVFRTNKNEPN